MEVKEKMKTTIPKILFVLGVILLFAGIIIGMVAPKTATWKPESRTLADEETLTVSAGWKSKSGVLADEESLSTSLLWQSKSDSLIDKVITVDLYETYDYWWGYKPWIYEEAKDFVITGSAIEQSSPQQWFNFYVFDSVNFDLWKAGSTYTAHYEAQGKTSVTFTFSIASEDDVPDTFYFVVEEYLLEPVVRVTATIDWVEKSARYDYTNYYVSYGPFLTTEAKDFVIEGTAGEVGNNKFNFYIMDSSNYYNWYDDEAYTAYYDVKDVSTITFSVSLTEDQATSSIYFVVENPSLDINETVNLSATISWTEKASRSDCSEYLAPSPPIIINGETKDFKIKGNATEINGNKFNFYIMDSSNYWYWVFNEPYTAIFEQKDATSVMFDKSVTSRQTLYFVAENTLKNVDVSVSVNAELEWQEKAIIARTIGGWILGGVVAFIGFIVMLVSGIAVLVFREKPK